MTGLVLGATASAGVFYLYTAFVFGWRGLRPGPAPASRVGRRRRGAEDWLVQAGLAGVDVRQFALVTAALAAGGALVGLALLGGPLPALVLGGCLAAVPAASYRVRR
jgi:hypothetical protein